MNVGRLALPVVIVLTIAVPASAKFLTPEKHPGSCIAIYNQSKVTLSVRVIKPKVYSGTVWKIGPNNIYGNPLGVALTTSRGPIVSSSGDWDISVEPSPGKVGWDYIPAKTSSCDGTWYASVGVPAG